MYTDFFWTSSASPVLYALLKILKLRALCLSVGLPGGLARSSHSSSSSDIKREDKEDDENSSVADKSEEEKKDTKAARSRTR